MLCGRSNSPPSVAPVLLHVYQIPKLTIQALQMTTPTPLIPPSPITERHNPLLSIPHQPGGERAQLHHCPCLLLTALVAIHPLSSCSITDGGNNIASAGYHNNRPQHPVYTTLASHHHAPCAGLRAALSAVVIHFTRYHHHHHHGHGGTFLRLFGLSIERGRWPL